MTVHAEMHKAQMKPHLIGSHGMAVFQDNQQSFYISHMPLFHSPHNYQIVYKIEVNNDKKLTALLATGMVTLLPKPFDLNKLIDGESFGEEADIYQGHFERGGKLITSTRVNFVTPILIKKIDALDSTSDSIRPKSIVNNTFYTAKVNNNQAILVHKIEKKPSFDVIAFSSTLPSNKTEENTFSGCKIEEPLRAIHIIKQLKHCDITEVVYLETQDFN
jgi:hypothetical protein